MICEDRRYAQFLRLATIKDHGDRRGNMHTHTHAHTGNEYKGATERAEQERRLLKTETGPAPVTAVTTSFKAR